MPIDDDLLPVPGEQDVQIPPGLRTHRRTERPPSDADVDTDAPPPPVSDAYPEGTDPTTIELRLDEWAAWHDTLTEAKGPARRHMSKAKHTLDIAVAAAHKRAKRSPSKDRRTVADIEADVVTTGEVVRAREEFDDAEVRYWQIVDLIKNAEMNIDRLRTHSATARTLDPRGPQTRGRPR